MYDNADQQTSEDSLSFLRMRLAQTPAALGFEDVEKGYFPHKFNTRANEYYVGRDPDPSYYGYETCDTEQTSFMRWCSTVCGEKCDFQAELSLLCQ